MSYVGACMRIGRVNENRLRFPIWFPLCPISVTDLNFNSVLSLPFLHDVITIVYNTIGLYYYRQHHYPDAALLDVIVLSGCLQGFWGGFGTEVK